MKPLLKAVDSPRLWAFFYRESFIEWMLLHQKQFILLFWFHPAHHPGGECICMFSFPFALQHIARLLKSYYHSCTESPFSDWSNWFHFLLLLGDASSSITDWPASRVADSISSNTDIPLSNPICVYDATKAVMFHQSRSRSVWTGADICKLRIY